MAWLERTRPTGHGRARGLVSDRRSGARVEARAFEPPADLADVVEVFWVGRWDLPPDAPHTTRLLGDPCVHVVLERDAVERPPQRVVGVWTRLWENPLRGRGAVRGMKLRAGAAGALLEVAASVRNRVVALDAVVDGVPPVADLGWDPDHDARAFDRLADGLRRWRREDPGTAEAIAACRAVVEDPALSRVDQLAARLGCTERAVQRRFRRHVGAPPKFVIRRQRLQEAAVRLERGDAVSLADLAHGLGYADQAHFARDWKAATGMTAGAFAQSAAR